MGTVALEDVEVILQRNITTMSHLPVRHWKAYTEGK